MKEMPSVYAEILKRNIPKALTLIDFDPVSPTCGFADRTYWGWKTLDFANGTMQGVVHSLAISLKLGLVSNPSFILTAMDRVIRAIPSIREKNGSLAEAYPRENSFCVTALLAFDILSAILLLRTRLSGEQEKTYLKIVAPLIHFLNKNDEVHAIISNHLSTAAAALFLWSKLTGASDKRAFYFLNLIYKYQSREGWYLEYEGADPGYQTLTMYYLFSIYRLTGDKKLLDSLIRSAKFLIHFIHPDGTLGGTYGSRNTEVYYPAGFAGLAGVEPDFIPAKQKLEEAIISGRHIIPDSIDTENFIPLLNSYAAAALFEKTSSSAQPPPKENYISLPFTEQFERDFSEAGIFIKSTAHYYAIINYKKGGVIKVFDKNTGLLDIEDSGLAGTLSSGKKFSTQHFQKDISFTDYKIISNFFILNLRSQTPFDFILLRLFSLSIFRSVFLGNLFKKFIVRLLMTGKKRIDGFVERKFIFSEDKIDIMEKIQPPSNSIEYGHKGKFRSIHMASSGYYIRQLEEMPPASKIVRFIRTGRI